jgi:hypothetical protein
MNHKIHMLLLIVSSLATFVLALTEISLSTKIAGSVFIWSSSLILITALDSLRTTHSWHKEALMASTSGNNDSRDLRKVA